ncbi:hypothetical protein JQN72_02200 [Phycicoccus sp. CSK15P-2]|uniref:Clp protease N-terminal domain-containing protein n=1 Tax=Phycicoccus sp. CSK15P-2 TaxID=2807627 RepID=UPI00195252FD|nr:Clp protease N-terminal domain-containing protein [Phycicoccus sp. CSK15P-2]MBM6403058.1 hypothetical protein [Phycicoccus sp. CSK15P-2]
MFEDGDAEALRSLGIDLDSVRDAVESSFGTGALDASSPSGDDGPRRTGLFAGHRPVAASTKKALELALREALRQGVREIRAEHVALGLLRCGDKELRRVLQHVGADERSLRAELEGRGRRSA